MSNYYVTFNNHTPEVWTLGVYQTLPSSPGLDSVSWLQTSSPPTEGTSSVEWEVNYNVAIAQYTQEGGIGVYPPDSAQILPADLGTMWNIVWDGNVQSLEKANTAAPQADQIIITNQSNHLANPGIGMNGSPALYQNQVYGGAQAEFIVQPVYWVALFNSLILGEVISSNVSVGPHQLTFTGTNSATVTASIQGENIVMDVSYGTRTSVDMNQLSERVGGRNTYQKQLHGRSAGRQSAAR
jgi:hypothetical protein